MSLRSVFMVVIVLVIVISLIIAYFVLNLQERATTTTTVTSIITYTITQVHTYTVTVPTTQMLSIQQETITPISLNESSTTVVRIGPCANGVPYYVGSMLYKCLNLDIAKKLSTIIQEYLGQHNGTQIIMFGLSTCPHCHVMYEFFTNNSKYRSIYTAIWLDKTKNGESLFESLYITEVYGGVSPRLSGAVPHIYVTKNGFVYSIVIGEITEETFWDKLIE